MNLHFYKYQGTGNDFVMIDNRNLTFPKENTALIAQLCDRKFGIGADGLLLLEPDTETHFKMVYYNADGNQSTMCGNGGRCIVAFAKKLEIIEKDTFFTAIDGLHFATIEGDEVALQMKNITQIKQEKNYTFLNTGSPHHVEMVTNIDAFDVYKHGKTLRYSALYGKEGSNINFVEQISEAEFKVRTYERGVENETLSCGTGVTAVAIAMNVNKLTTKNTIKLQTPGGTLEVSFAKNDSNYEQVFLKGKATFVFEGNILID